MKNPEEGYAEIRNKRKDQKLLFALALGKQDITSVKALLEIAKENQRGIYERESLIISIFIIYGRIFHKNFELPRLDLSKMHCQLNENEKAYHFDLIALRNKIFAHNDPLMKNIQIIKTQEGKLETIPSWNTSIIDQQSSLAESLFAKIEKCLSKEHDKLLNKLYGSDNGIVYSKSFVSLGYSSHFWQQYSTNETK